MHADAVGVGEAAPASVGLVGTLSGELEGVGDGSGSTALAAIPGACSGGSEVSSAIKAALPKLLAGAKFTVVPQVSPF